jgi:hypothetical protein
MLTTEVKNLEASDNGTKKSTARLSEAWPFNLLTRHNPLHEWHRRPPPSPLAARSYCLRTMTLRP